MDYPDRVPEADIRGVSDDFGDKWEPIITIAPKTSLVRKSVRGPHASRANLAANLAACRTRKAGFDAAQGDFSDAPQLGPSCPVGGLHAEPCYYRRQITGKVCGLDSCREFVFGLRLLQTLPQSRFTALSPIDYRL